MNIIPAIGAYSPAIRSRLILGLLAILLGLTLIACSDADKSHTLSAYITDKELRDYLLEHPEFILDNPEILNAINQARSLRHQEASALRRISVLADQADLLNSSLTPATGDTQPVVTVIEFYDYQCIPCKASYPELEQMRAAETDIRILYAQLPVFGSHSILAARGAIAAQRQGLFEAYHHALMTAKTRLNMDSIVTMAAEVGLDIDQLQTDMRDPEVIDYLEAMRLLADDLEVTGTPAFIVGDAILRGGITVKELKTELERQRARHKPLTAS